MIINFTTDDIVKCQDFANNLDTSFYASRKQFNAEKRIKDQIVGKISEITAHSYLTSKGIDVSYPDFKIYAKKDKSWDYDMKNGVYNFHIKGQNIEQSKKYGTSWIFERTDRHIFKDHSANDYVCFVVVDLTKMETDIKYVISINNLHKLELFKPTKLAHLTSKAAVYYDDIKDLSSEYRLV